MNNQGDISGIGGFKSTFARRCVQLGFLGVFGLPGYFVPGWHQVTAVTSLFALFGVGYAIEFVFRLRHGISVFTKAGK